jgi:hypothetical protein
LTYGESSGDTYCSEEDYETHFDEADRSRGLLNIVVVKRGICTFVTKVRIAQDSKGADAVIIVDRDDSPYTPNTIRNIIVADDGTGSTVSIPSILIAKEAGNELISWLETEGQEPILVELDWDIPADKIVTLDMWMSSDAFDLRTFVQEFADLRSSLGWNLFFSPHYIVYSLSNPPEGRCWDHIGAYCADDPDGAGPVTGRQVLVEDIRQMCILENTLIEDVHSNTETQFSVKYWFYIREFLNSCPIQGQGTSQFGEACGDVQMNKFLTEAEQTAVRTCMAETAEAKLDLSRSQVAWSTRAVRVNGWRFSGPTDVDVIGRAICSAFVEENLPEACRAVLGAIDKCPPGTSETGANKYEHKCVPCAEGTFSPVSADSCFMCLAGTYSRAGASSCTPCVAGSVSGMGASRCTMCPYGMYATGSDQCAHCPKGTISEQGSTACQVCPTGTIAVQKTTCEACSAGYAPDPDEDRCVPCPGGSYAPERSPVCLPCPKDKYGRDAEIVEGAGVCTYPARIPTALVAALVPVVLVMCSLCYLCFRIRSATQDAKKWQELYYLHKGRAEQPFTKLGNESDTVVPDTA